MKYKYVGINGDECWLFYSPNKLNNAKDVCDNMAYFKYHGAYQEKIFDVLKREHCILGKHIHYCGETIISDDDEVLFKYSKIRELIYIGGAHLK